MPAAVGVEFFQPICTPFSIRPDNPIRPFWFLEVLFEVSLAGYAVDRIVRSRLVAVRGTASPPTG